ncbi:hypothetical protein GLYMA_06G195633v4 [Glycine max]|nr:hypothetical protein GLYMA_06G195633v4 [Glycine max]KAG4389966.1 hypothetical protein GLYMA_06G195633v4 [Glycine max]
MGSEKVEKHIKVAIFISKTSWVQRRWKKTLKLPFFTPKSFHFYLIFMSKDLSPLFLCLHVHFLCFCFSIFLFRSSPFIFLHILFSLFLCFSNFNFRSSSFLFIFRLTLIFVLVPFLFISLHVNCFL